MNSKMGLSRKKIFNPLESASEYLFGIFKRSLVTFAHNLFYKQETWDQVLTLGSISV